MHLNLCIFEQMYGFYWKTYKYDGCSRKCKVSKMESVKKTLEHIGKEEMADILKIQSAAMKAVHDYMWGKGVPICTPVILSTVTDPLNHPIHDSSIRYKGAKLELTKSMILHKQLAISRGNIRGIYIVSPNVRLEKDEEAESGRHLLEFSQVDIELKGASAEEFMRFMEGIYVHIIKYVKAECAPELGRLGRELTVPAGFKVYESKKLEAEYGAGFEGIVSEKEEAPFWILGHKREFYDREDKESGEHINYDFVYPEGFGEALSGGEREHEYGRILEKMGERGTRPEDFAPYLHAAQIGALVPSAGGGFGVERLVRFLCGKEHVREVVLFPKVPGEEVVF